MGQFDFVERDLKEARRKITWWTRICMLLGWRRVLVLSNTVKLDVVQKAELDIKFPGIGCSLMFPESIVSSDGPNYIARVKEHVFPRVTDVLLLDASDDYISVNDAAILEYALGCMSPRRIRVASINTEGKIELRPYRREEMVGWKVDVSV